MSSRSWYAGLAIVAVVYLHNTLPFLTMLPRVNVDEPWLMERGYQVMRTGIPSQPMLGLQHAYLLQVGYGYVLAIWMTLTGVGLFQARLLAVLMGLGVVLMTAVIGRRAIDPAAGLCAALLLALDSNVLGGMRSARTDAPSIFFVVCAFAAYLRGQRLSRPLWFAVCGACLGVAMLCHGNAFWAGIILLAWFLIDYGRRALSVPFGYAVIGGWALTCGPYLAVAIARWSDVQVQIGNFAADRVPGWRVSFVVQQMQREMERYRGWYFGLITADVPNPLLWAFQALILAGFVALAWRVIRPRLAESTDDPRGALRILILATGGALIFAGFINNKVPVYLPHILFGFALAAGVAVSEALRLAPVPTRSSVALALLIAYSALGLAYYEKWYARERKSELVPYESTEATLRALVPAGPKSLFASPQFWTPFHADPSTTFLSFAAGQPIESGESIALADVPPDRPVVLVIDEYQWLPELTGVSSSPPQWQRDWIAFIERRCSIYGVAYGTAHGTLASYVCALNGAVSPSRLVSSAPKLIGGATEYRARSVVLDDDAATLATWPHYVDPRRNGRQQPQVELTDSGLRIRGTGWPGIETAFKAEVGATYLVRPTTSGTRDGDLLYLGGWEHPQVESLSGASAAGIPAALLAPAWFPRERAFRATDSSVRIRIYSEAPRTDFLISALQIARLEPVR
jgi:4-amino-4-deoxy-L-arabinose transferase-like glycosyltransferase